jgi:hypothetical protein
MTLYRLELAGESPTRRQLCKNSVAWLDSDITGCAKSRQSAGLGERRHHLRAVRLAFEPRSPPDLG